MQWAKTGSATVVAFILAGVQLAFGSRPVGFGLIGVGVLLATWLAAHAAGWQSPWEVRRRGTTHDQPGEDRRELLSLAHNVATELATCRVRVERIDAQHIGWYDGLGLPAQAYQRWADSQSTAGEAKANELLRAFYVWADDINLKMTVTAHRQFHAVGKVIEPGEQVLVGADIGPAVPHGLRLLSAAEQEIAALIDRYSEN